MATFYQPRRVSIIIFLFLFSLLAITSYFYSPFRGDAPLYDSVVVHEEYTPLVNQSSSKSSIKTIHKYSSIPASIYQTGPESLPPSHFSDTSWVLSNPGYAHHYFDDAQAAEFVSTYASDEIKKAYKQLPLPILKADFFRYIVIYYRGGTYTDMDTNCLKTIDLWISPMDRQVEDIAGRKEVGMIVGIEADVGDRDDWARWYSHELQFCQWTFSAAPFHPLLKSIISRIVSHTPSFLSSFNANASGSSTADLEKLVMGWTGPKVWTEVVQEYLWRVDRRHWRDFVGLKKPLLVGGDVYVLPITGFSPGVGHMGSGEMSDWEARVEHKFKGSWREKGH